MLYPRGSLPAQGMDHLGIHGVDRRLERNVVTQIHRQFDGAVAVQVFDFCRASAARIAAMSARRIGAPLGG